MKRDVMKRDVRIDTLRTIGILLIVLAHVSPPEKIFVLRMFDVPLMTFLMGMGMFFSSNNSVNYTAYVIKRIKRLLLPAFIFLVVFFIFFNLINLISINQFKFDLKYYLGSFSTFAGVGYVWIVRIFFLIAILSPVFFALNKVLNNVLKRLTFFTLLLLIQGITTNFLVDKNGIIFFVISNLLVMTFGYAIVTLFGLWVYQQETKQNLLCLLYVSVLFSLSLLKHDFWDMPLLKYPPFPMYLLYGILISLLLWLILSLDRVEHFFENNKLVKWFSENSMLIYYWHIFPVFYIENYASSNYLTNN